MKYKVGDKVKLIINDNLREAVREAVIKDVDKLPGKVATISKVYDYYYRLKEITWAWTDDYIEGLEEKIKYTKYNRFEIMDI